MSLLLNIDTATEHASVCLSNKNEILAIEQSPDQKNHASFVQPGIQKIFQRTDHSLQDIDAVAVTAGPGSYTGLRVGLSSAKGLCYALNKPLILINTLEVMAWASISESNDNNAGTSYILFCPMIDARRMEVFTAVYDQHLQIIIPPAAMILEPASFRKELEEYKIIFSGNGIAKLKNILQHQNAQYSPVLYHGGHLAHLAIKAFVNKQFADLAYSTPFYFKEFFTPQKKI